MFQDQQYMELVSHVSSCPNLNSGLYQCPYCNKEESFSWEVPYGFDKEGAVTGAHSLANPYAGHLVHASPHQTLGSSNNGNNNNHHNNPHFQAGFVERDPDCYPEVLLREQRVSRSPNSAMGDSSKRKFDQFDERFAAELSNGSTQGQAGQMDQQYMVELPSQNIARRSSAHISPRASPAAMPRNSPSMQGAMQMNMVNYGLGVAVAERNSSPMMSRFGTEQVALGVGQMMQQTQSQIVGNSPSNRGMSPNKSENRALNNGSVIASQVSPSGQEGRSSIPTKPRQGDGASGGTTSEAERGSVTCKQCGKVLQGKVAWLPSNLQRHMREIHLSAPKTECRVCGRTFNRGHNLRHHMKAVHGEQP